MPDEKIALQYAEHRGARVILLKFAFNTELQKEVRSLRGVRWSQTKRCWYVFDRPGLLEELSARFCVLNNYGPQSHPSIGSDSSNGQLASDCGVSSPERVQHELVAGSGQPQESRSRTEHTQKMRDSAAIDENVEKLRDYMRSKRYSNSTVCTYTDALRVFLRFHREKDVQDLTETDLVAFNNRYILQSHLSASYQNQVVNAVKLFFSVVENKHMRPELIHRPKRAKLLPNVLSKEEVRILLERQHNLKHKSMLSLIYSCGLRCGELLGIRMQHIDRHRGLLVIKQSKGKKDRIVPLSLKTFDLLDRYFATFHPRDYLFEGQKPGEPYDSRSLQQVMKQSLHKAGIQKPATLHWLRHSYATHLMDKGTNLRYIQTLLGHNSSRTTEIYTHVSKAGFESIISPFDEL